MVGFSVVTRRERVCTDTVDSYHDLEMYVFEVKLDKVAMLHGNIYDLTRKKRECVLCITN